jgi:hypothetical protein
MKQEFVVETAAQWVIHFLQYICDDPEEIETILELVNKSFSLGRKGEAA